MGEQEIASNLTFWMWVMGGCLAVIGSLVTVVFWLTNAKIDKIGADVAAAIAMHKEATEKLLARHEEEFKAELMKNDRDHDKFWQGFKDADKDRQTHCVSRAEYEKDTKHTSEAIMEIKNLMKETNKSIKDLNNLILVRMAPDKKG